MSTTNTSATKLNKPGFADRNWHLALNQNADWLDGQSALGGLCVTTAEVPSASLKVSIAPGRFRAVDGTVAAFSGLPALALAANSTTYVYLDASGNPGTSSSGFPSTACVPLAVVVAGASTIGAITDSRIQCAVSGPGSLPFLPLAGGTLNDGADISVGTGSGTRIATSASQKLGFWNAPPIAQPGPYVQSYSTADRAISAYSPSVQSSAFAGLDNSQAGTIYAKLADLNTLRTAYENLRAFTEDVAQALNALIDDLQAMGLVR
jgi:hypothetical protein